MRSEQNDRSCRVEDWQLSPCAPVGTGRLCWGLPGRASLLRFISTHLPQQSRWHGWHPLLHGPRTNCFRIGHAPPATSTLWVSLSTCGYAIHHPLLKAYHSSGLPAYPRTHAASAPTDIHPLTCRRVGSDDSTCQEIRRSIWFHSRLRHCPATGQPSYFHQTVEEQFSGKRAYEDRCILVEYDKKARETWKHDC
jgi:hypothetical protein